MRPSRTPYSVTSRGTPAKCRASRPGRAASPPAAALQRSTEPSPSSSYQSSERGRSARSTCAATHSRSGTRAVRAARNAPGARQARSRARTAPSERSAPTSPPSSRASSARPYSALPKRSATTPREASDAVTPPETSDPSRTAGAVHTAAANSPKHSANRLRARRPCTTPSSAVHSGAVRTRLTCGGSWIQPSSSCRWLD